MTTSGPVDGRSGRRPLRLPVLVLVVLVLAAAVWVREDGVVAPPTAAASVSASELATVAPDPGMASTWFCAGGTAVPDGYADHIVTVTNPGTQAVNGTLIVFPTKADPAPAVAIYVEAGASTSVRLGDIVVADFAAAQVEMQDGPVIVDHEVRGPTSRDVGRCSTRASETWSVPWGRTVLGSTMRLALFNPFPGDAVVDVTFDTEDGYRRPEAYQAMLVRSRQLVVLNVEDVVTRRDRVSAQVAARSGRLVVDRIQTVTDAGGTTLTTVGPGAPSAASTWFFPEGRVDNGTLEAFYLFNPADVTADVELTLLTGADPASQPEPFQLRLGPGTATELILNREPRVAQPMIHATAVQASGDVPVVVERVLASGGFAATFLPDIAAGGAPSALAPLPAGVAASLGQPVVATRWFVTPSTTLAGTDVAVVSLLNPGGGDTVRFRALAPDGAELAPATELASGRRTELSVTGPMVIEADGPVVVGQLWVFGGPLSVAAAPAVPQRDTASVAQAQPSLGGFGSVGPATTVPAAPAAGGASTTAPAAPATTAAGG